MKGSRGECHGPLTKPGSALHQSGEFCRLYTDQTVDDTDPSVGGGGGEGWGRAGWGEGVGERGRERVRYCGQHYSGQEAEERTMVKPYTGFSKSRSCIK